jgi:GNAT superfamily N-acetyltransferase
MHGAQRVQIRQMAAGDADEVAALCEQLGYPATPAEIVHRLGLIAEQRDHVVLVAESGAEQGGEAGTGSEASEASEDDERVVGWVHVRGQVLLEAAPYAAISGMVVERRLRGQGIGQLLLEAAETWARERGYDEMLARSPSSQESAHDFFERQGYRRDAPSYRFSKQL